jgi:hypothetical protein
MRLKAIAIAAAFAVCATSAANAAPPRKRDGVRTYNPGTIIVHRDEQGRTRTRILVQKRSYLDGGTEVMPGDNADAYRSSFLTNSPVSNALGPNSVTNPPGPIPGPFYLPGKNNPWPGFEF